MFVLFRIHNISVP